jgi:cobalt-zinc-cadmium efflux system outer membrane protein
MSPTRSASIVVLALAIGFSCSSARPTKARTELSRTLTERTGIADAIPARVEAETAAAVDRRVDEILARPLALDGAVQVALLANRSLRARLEDLGVAQADLVEAGLLDNPVFAGDLVVSTRGNGLGGGLALSQSLLSAFLIPAERRLAKARLRFAIVDVGQSTLELVRDVRVAFAGLQAAQARHELARRIVQAAEVADELAGRQSAAGNLQPLERAHIGEALDGARLDLLDRELERVEARERLTRLLGLWGDRADYALAGELAPIPGAEADLDTLERRGIAQRLDLSAARHSVEAMRKALELRRRGIVSQLDVDAVGRNEVGDDAGHEWVLGPGLAIELPIFDPGTADFARLRAELRRSHELLQHAAIVARSEIRLHREQLVAARRRVEYYADVVLPRHAAIVEESLALYDGMQLSAYDLFAARAGELQAQADYAEVLRGYWDARAQLELAIGGRLPADG